MQSVIKRPCPATRIHFQPYGQPSVERKTTTGERHPAASSRGYPSAGSHPRKGRRPRCPGNLLPPPIPGKTSGPGMPGPYRAAVGKPYAIHKRPRRGQDPSLRTDPPTSAHTLPRGGGQAPCRPQTPAEGSRPLPTDRPINEFPPPCRAAVRERRQKNRGDPFSRDCLGSLYKAI